MNKFHPYFGQVVTDTEFSEILNELTNSIERFVQDFRYIGIAFGAETVQHLPASYAVDIAGPSIVYDQQGRRITWVTPQTINLTYDENGATTAVVNASREKWLSIFVEFLSTPSDPRVDELGDTVYYRDVAGFRFHVVQGAESTIGAAAPAPLRGDQILIADVKIQTNQTIILPAHISTARTQVIFQAPGTSVSIYGRNLLDVVQSVVNTLNEFQVDSQDAFATFESDVAGQIDAIESVVTALSSQVLHVVGGDATLARLFANELLYPAPVERYLTLNLMDAFPVGSQDDPDAGGMFWDGSLTALVAHHNSSSIYLPFRLPFGAVIKELQVIFNQQTSTPLQFLLRRHTGVNWATVAVGSMVTIATDTSNVTPGIKTATIPSGGNLNYTVDNAVETYSLYCVAGAAGNRIHGARIKVLIPGYRVL